MTTAASNIMEQTDPAVLQQQYEAEQANAQGGGPGQGGDVNLQIPGADHGTAAKKPLYKTFGREFETAEDLVEYTKEMERQTVESRLAAERLGGQRSQNANTLLNPQGQPPPKQTGPEIEELLFTDPKKAVSMLLQKGRDDVMKELNAKEAERQFWGNFYDENPDLRNAERIVQSIVKEKWNEVANLPLAEAKKILAGETRALVEKIRAPGINRKELSQTSASSLPTSGASAPVVVAIQGESESFVAQLKKFQRKHTKR